MTDLELRSFQVREPWGRLAAAELGEAATRTWGEENSAPPLDTPPNIGVEATRCLDRVVALVPDEQTEFRPDSWGADPEGRESLHCCSRLHLQVAEYAGPNYVTQKRARSVQRTC